MVVRLVCVAFDADDPEPVARFWAELLGREPVAEPGSIVLPGQDVQVGLRFVRSVTESAGPNRAHLHLASESLTHQQQTVERALGLGATHLNVGQLPEEEHVVMADPDGNAFCVIEPGNNYLTGCGFLAEVTGEGSPAVGRFWQAALGWPLVWDQGDQTVVQSPQGGTKIAWDVGDEPYGSKRQTIEVASDDFDADLARLSQLDATLMRRDPGRAVLTDPDGAEFTLTDDSV